MDYRENLVLADQKAQEDYDKTVLSLSGGALGISFAFVKDIVGPSFKEPKYLFVAWLCWGLSVCLVLISYFVSHLALRKAIGQVDSENIHVQRPGGAYDIMTLICNASGGLLFLLGVIATVKFVATNINP